MAEMTGISSRLLAAALVSAAIATGLGITGYGIALVGTAAAQGAGAAPAEAGKGPWAASAPGRVEPKDGEIRMISVLTGRIAAVLVGVNDQVEAGDPLVQLEDEEHEARYAAAEAEVAVRTRERDGEKVSGLAKDRRVAEDAVAKAERALFEARTGHDAVWMARRAGKATASELSRSREAMTAALAALAKERASARKIAGQANMPLPTRLEAGLTVARSDLTLAETALTRTRVRAPSAGTVLAVNAKVGEIAAPQMADLPLVVIADLARLQVRAELVERDVSKVHEGQAAIVTSDAFPGRQFEGKVSQVAKGMAVPKLANKGPRRPNDVDVLEVLIDLPGNTPLLPGMRADVFFRQASQAAAKSN
jgi:HlyD family secretion protein